MQYFLDTTHVSVYTFGKILACPETWLVLDSAGKQVAELKATSGKLFCDKGGWGGETLYSASIQYPTFTTVAERSEHFLKIVNILQKL